MPNLPAFLVGGTTSGSGKTTITLGLLAALRQRGMKVQSFKCGPDFIDPTLHTMVTGNVSRNLDLRMAGAEFCRASFVRNVSEMDAAVIEGVMGLFDGGPASAASLAVSLTVPVVLVIDVRSAAESIAAVLKGFELYNQEVRIAGVICNRVGSARHEALIREAVEHHCSSKILGFFPREASFAIPERHLGLHMGDESPLNSRQIEALAQAVEEHIDVDSLLRCTLTAVPDKPHDPPFRHPDRRVRLAVARDRAFCFYYQDNFDLFAQYGIDCTFFSPLQDTSLPADCDGLYFGGGYPELYAAELSGNVALRRRIREWAESGGPVFCECGGFMYMAERLLDLEGREFPMVGVFPATIAMQAKLNRLGYREATLTRACMFGDCGDRLYGHEFHYSTIREIAPDVATAFTLQDGRNEGYLVKNVLGGYLHLHFGQTEKGVARLHNFLLQRCIGK